MKAISLISLADSLMPEQTKEQTDFSFLSKEAQDAIVWAVMSLPGETPPVLSNAAKRKLWNGAMVAINQILI